MKCECIIIVNGLLAAQNSELTVALFSNRVVVETQKLDAAKRGKPSTVVANFCPFCGSAYEVKP